MISPLLLLGIYGVALVIFSLAGGRLPERVAMTHIRTQLAMSLVSGLLLGIAFFHLLPHALLTLGGERGVNAAMSWAIAGLIVMLLLLRLLHFHQPDYLGGWVGAGDRSERRDHEHTISPLPTPEHGGPVNRWQGVLVGLTFHTLIDGVALGATLLASAQGHGEPLMGFGVFLAILLHKPLDAMSITALMKGGGASLRAQRSANLLFALVCPVTALAFYAYAGSLGAVAGELVASALAFSAGAFVCIALSDLLPEVQFHSHDRVKLTAVFLFGIVLSYLLANASPEHGSPLEPEAQIPAYKRCGHGQPRIPVARRHTACSLGQVYADRGE